MGLRILPLALLPVLAAGCGAPKDPDASTERVMTSHVLRAGAADSPPWIRAASGEPQGREADLVRAFAASLGARVAWTHGGEEAVLQALERRELDVVAAGASSKTPWARKLGVSSPYATTPGPHGPEKRVLLVAPGENQLLLRLDRYVKRQPSGAAG